MDALHIVAVLLCCAQVEGRAFDTCNCEDLDDPTVNVNEGLKDGDTENYAPSDISREPTSLLESGAEHEVNQLSEKSRGLGDVDAHKTRKEGSDNTVSTIEAMNRREREAKKEDDAKSTNERESETGSKETGSETETKENGSETGSGTGTKETGSETGSKETGSETDSETGTKASGSEKDSETGTKEKGSKTGPSENEETTVATDKSSATTETNCPQHYKWYEELKHCLYEPENVPEAKYDDYGNIDANAIGQQILTSTESTPTTTTKHDCPEHEEWDDKMQGCFFDPQNRDPAKMDNFGDVFANALEV